MWVLALVTGIVVLFGWPAWMAWWDAYAGYSGTIVAKGEDYLILARMREHTIPYLILINEQGVRSKRYVTRAISDKVKPGIFISKKRGFGEEPAAPGLPAPQHSSILWGIVEAGILVLLVVAVIRTIVQSTR